MSNELLNLANQNESQDFFTSCVPTTEEERIMLYKAMTAPDLKLSELINTEIVIRDYTLEKVTLTDDDGTEREAIRIGLICLDGTTVTTISNGVLRSLKALCAIYGAPTWKEGIKVKVQQIERNGRRVFNLVPVFKG